MTDILDYSDEIKKALGDLFMLYAKYDVTYDARKSDCARYKQQVNKLKDAGLPPPPA